MTNKEVHVTLPKNVELDSIVINKEIVNFVIIVKEENAYKNVVKSITLVTGTNNVEKVFSVHTIVKLMVVKKIIRFVNLATNVKNLLVLMEIVINVLMLISLEVVMIMNIK